MKQANSVRGRWGRGRLFIGARRSTRTQKTERWLKPTLVNAAWAATHKKDSYLRAIPPAVAQDLEPQEVGTLFIHPKDGTLGAGSEDVMAMLDLLEERLQFAAEPLGESEAEDLRGFVRVSRSSPMSHERSNSL
jgi:hypothetical protein